MHPVTALFIGFWFAVPVFLVGVGLGSRRIGLLVLPWFGVWAAARLFTGTVTWSPAPWPGLVMIGAPVAGAFRLGWLAGAGRWIGNARAASAILAVFGAGLIFAIRGLPAAPSGVSAPTPAVEVAATPGGIDDRAGLLTSDARGKAEHYIRILADRGITYRIVTGPALAAVVSIPGPRGVVLEAARREFAVRLTVGRELAPLLTPEQCASLAAGARRELSAGNAVGAFWSTSADLQGVLVEGHRPPGPLTDAQRSARRVLESTGAWFAASFISLFMFGLGMLVGFSIGARNLLVAAPGCAIGVAGLAFFISGYLDIGLWWPALLPVAVAVTGAGAGLGMARRRPGLLRPDPPLRRWAWGLRIRSAGR